MGNSSGAVQTEEQTPANIATEQAIGLKEEMQHPAGETVAAPPAAGEAVKAAEKATTLLIQNGGGSVPLNLGFQAKAPPPTSAPPPVTLPPEPSPPARAAVVPGADRDGDEDARLEVSPGRRQVQPPPPVQLVESESSSEEEDPDLPKPEIILGPDGLPSVGSAGHDAGWAMTQLSSGSKPPNGFCHFDHVPRKRLKKKKGKGSEAETPNNGTTGSVQIDLNAAVGALDAIKTAPLAYSPQIVVQTVAPAVASTPLGRQGLPLSPAPNRVPRTPVTPTAPPMAPPALGRLNLEDTPPPPPPSAPGLPDSPVTEGTSGEAAAEARGSKAVADSSESGTTPSTADSAPAPPEGDADLAARAPQADAVTPAKPSKVQASPAHTPKAQPVATPVNHGAKGTPVTLNDLLAPTPGQGKPEGSPLATVPNGNGCAVHSKDLPRPRPLLASLEGPDQWPMGYWNPYPYYGDLPAVPLSSASAPLGRGIRPPHAPPPPPVPAPARLPMPSPYGGFPPPPTPAPLAPPPGAPLAYGAPPQPIPRPPGAAPLPVPHPTVLTPHPPAPASVATGGLECDSPRSVLLTLCGAWGALKAGGGKEELLNGKEGEGEPQDGISRSKMLALRALAGADERPEALTTFKAKYLAKDMQ